MKYGHPYIRRNWLVEEHALKTSLAAAMSQCGGAIGFMNKLVRLRSVALALTATIMVTLGLGFISEMNEKKPALNSDVAAFTPVPRLISMNDRQLVDLLSDIPLQLRLSRAAWQDGKLTLDIKVAASIVHPEIIYQDMYELLRYSFTQTNNVNRLLLRFVILDERLKKKHVLLALDALKSETPPERLEQIKKSNPDIPQEVSEALRIIYTPLWERQFSASRLDSRPER